MLFSRSEIKLTRKDYGAYTYEADGDLSKWDIEENIRHLAEAVQVQQW